MPRLFAIFCLLALGTPVNAAQPDPARLEKLKKQITILERNLGQSNQERAKVNNSLKQIESRIGELGKQQATLEQSLTTTQTKQAQLESQQSKLLAKKQGQVDALVALIRQQYATGQDANLKLLLNQQDPDKIARVIEYQRRIEQARSQQIEQLNASLTELAGLSDQLLANKQLLLKQQQEINTKQQALQQSRNERSALLASLNKKIDQQTSDLTNLKTDHDQLQKLLDGMRAIISDIPPNLNRPFGKLTNSLPWPVKGNIAQSYRSIVAGTVRLDGVVMNASIGTPVHAIYSGRVVYSDWLSGFGLMIIIDQGDGYMSLYGYNDNLMHEVGDWVAAGDIIAHAGNSGGRREPGLYFAIRKNGKPVNPANWCNARFSFGGSNTWALPNH